MDRKAAFRLLCVLTPQQLHHHLIARARLQLVTCCIHSATLPPACFNNLISVLSVCTTYDKAKIQTKNATLFLCHETFKNIIARGIHNVHIVSSVITCQEPRWEVKIYSFKGSKLRLEGACWRQVWHVSWGSSGASNNRRSQRRPNQRGCRNSSTTWQRRRWKGWAWGLSMSSVKAPLGCCRSKRTKSSWLNCRAASCGRYSQPGNKKHPSLKTGCLKQSHASLLNILLLLD